jgi:TRAP transporter TAXI family solute receptor
MRLFSKAIVLALVLLLGHGFWSRAQAEDGISLFTGSTKGTYFQFGRDIARIAKPAGVKVFVRESKGSIDNIRQLSKGDGALGIVQSDVMGFLSRSREPEMQRFSRRLRFVFPFYQEEVHLLAAKSIQSFGDLSGKRVVVGEADSGSWLTGLNLLRMAGVTPASALYLSPREALAAVLEGRADAMFYVAGKPVRLFAELEGFQQDPKYRAALANVHFVPLEETIMLREYEPAELGSADYPWFQGKVPTIAVQSVLMTLDYEADDSAEAKRICDALAKLGQAMRGNIEQLRQQGHPKWREVKLDGDAGLWRRDSCSRQ